MIYGAICEIDEDSGLSSWGMFLTTFLCQLEAIYPSADLRILCDTSLEYTTKSSEDLNS